MSRPIKEPPPNISLPERSAGEIDAADPTNNMDAHRPVLPGNGKLARRPKRVKPKRLPRIVIVKVEG